LADRILVMGSNPGRVVEFIQNPVPRPRAATQFIEPEFLALKRRLEDLIHPPLDMEEEKLPMIKLTGAGDDVE
jgi:NitT/TauT family transport system ATP-binding protein